jgi:Membrane-fusion protein
VVWTLVILLVLGIAGWSVYSRLRAEYRTTYEPYTAITGSISNSLSFTGSMQLINSASYTASGEGKVREVYVAQGDSVSKGDKLIRLSGGETVEAEFDGTVSTLNVEKGDEVKAGDSLATVADFDHMRVSVRVGESNISEVSVGQSCRVTVSSAGATFDSVIGTIDYVAYTGNNVAYYTATVDVDTAAAENLWPGMQATVTVPLEEAENVTVLKMDALSTARDNTAYVYKENDAGEMEEVQVTVGVSNGNYVEIREGVTAGETSTRSPKRQRKPRASRRCSRACSATRG